MFLNFSLSRANRKTSSTVLFGFLYRKLGGHARFSPTIFIHGPFIHQCPYVFIEGVKYRETGERGRYMLRDFRHFALEDKSPTALNGNYFFVYRFH